MWWTDTTLSALEQGGQCYRSTNLIHDHMRSWLPEFSDLDWSMPVNIDVAGECNAFYDGGRPTSSTPEEGAMPLR